MNLSLFFMSRYRNITHRETGRIGSLFYLYIVAINSAWGFGLAALITQMMT